MSGSMVCLDLVAFSCKQDLFLWGDFVARLKTRIMDEKTVERALLRISHEIAEHNKGVEGVCLVGILRRGKSLAEIIADNLFKIEGKHVPVGTVDINFYRDDLTKASETPVLNHAELPFSIVDQKVILVDDVLFTGRTVRAAIEAIFQQGRPSQIQLAILVDRGHRELPIRADYVGKNIPTSLNERISVFIPPFDDEVGVGLYDVTSDPTV